MFGESEETNVDYRRLMGLETSKRLVAYACAAGASVAGTATAHAQIEWVNLEDIFVPQGTKQILKIDLDEFDDIEFKNYVFLGGNYQGAFIPFFPGKLVGFQSGLAYVSALNKGAVIDSVTEGPSFIGSMAYGATNPNAQFNSVTDKFVGFSFLITDPDPEIGQLVHYAWVRVDVDNAAGVLRLKDYGWNKTPFEGILAGQGIGDFDADQSVDLIDMELLHTAVRTNVQDLTFDMTGTGEVNFADLAEMVEYVFESSVGDTDLDGVVDDTDFVSFTGNFGLTGSTTWAGGDINADGRVGIRDGMLILQNYAAPASVVAVPEPGTLGLLAAGAAALGWMRRRQPGSDR